MNRWVGIDTSDMMTNLHPTLRKYNKWYKKLAFHLSDLCVTNSYISFKSVTSKSMTHTDYLMKVAMAQIENGIETMKDRPMLERAGRRSMEEGQKPLVTGQSLLNLVQMLRNRSLTNHA